MPGAHGRANLTGWGTRSICRWPALGWTQGNYCNSITGTLMNETALCASGDLEHRVLHPPMLAPKAGAGMRNPTGSNTKRYWAPCCYPVVGSFYPKHWNNHKGRGCLWPVGLEGSIPSRTRFHDRRWWILRSAPQFLCSCDGSDLELLIALAGKEVFGRSK